MSIYICVSSSPPLQRGAWSSSLVFKDWDPNSASKATLCRELEPKDMTVVNKENSEFAGVVVFIEVGKKERKVEVKTTDLALIK